MCGFGEETVGFRHRLCIETEAYGRSEGHVVRIQGICTSASIWRRRIPSTSFSGRKLSYLRYDIRAKNTDPRSLSTSTTMITGPDRNRRHMIVSALSLRSRRATGGRRKAELCLLFRGYRYRSVVWPNNPTDLSTVITHRSNDAPGVHRHRQGIRHPPRVVEDGFLCSISS